MTIKELRQSMHLTQKQFAAFFEIKLRTIQEWEQGRRTPPDYIPKLLERVWRLEKENKNISKDKE